MNSRRTERGNALLLAVIVVLVMAVVAVGVIRFAYQEVGGATAVRKQAAAAACAEAARGLLMSQWKLLGTQGMQLTPLNITVESSTPTYIRGGHYGQVGVTGVQVIKLNPLTVGPSTSSSDISNRIADQVQPYRVVVHCTQNTGTDTRELEIEFGVSFGL